MWTVKITHQLLGIFQWLNCWLIGFYPHHTPVSFTFLCQLGPYRRRGRHQLKPFVPKGKGIPLQIENLRNIGISVHICSETPYFHVLSHLYTLWPFRKHAAKLELRAGWNCGHSTDSTPMVFISLDCLHSLYWFKVLLALNFLPITQTQKHVQKSYWIIWKNIMYVKHTNNQNHQNPQRELTPLVSVALLPHRLGRCGWRPEDRWNRPSWQATPG